MVFIPGILLGRALLNKAGSQTPRRSFRIVERRNCSSLQRETETIHRSGTRQKNPFERNELLNRLGGTSLRVSSWSKSSSSDTPSTSTSSIVDDSNAEWRPVFRFRGIWWGVILARAKLLQTIACCAIMIYSIYQYQDGGISVEYAMGASGMAIFALFMLIVCTRYFNRLIGVISIDRSRGLVRIGYLTFWGTRQNRLLHIDDFVTIGDLAVDPKDAVITLRQFSNSRQFLYLPLRGVEIVDEDDAEWLFGDLSVFNANKKKNE